MSDNDKLLRSVGNFLEVEIRDLLVLLLLIFPKTEEPHLIHNLSIFRMRQNTNTNDSAFSQDSQCFYLELPTPLPPIPTSPPPTPDISDKFMTKVLRIG